MAVLTVNPGGGAMYTTLISAINAGGLSDIIELQADIYENLVFYKRVPLIRGQAGIHPKWHPSASGSPWLINGAMNGENKVSNIHFSGAWNAPQVDHNATTVGQVIVLEDCTFTPDAGNNRTYPQAVRIRPQGLNFENVIISRCKFFGHDGASAAPQYHIYVDQTNALDAIEVINCWFSQASTTSVFVRGLAANTVMHMHNCSFNNNQENIDSNSRLYVTNNSLISDVINIVCSGNCAESDFEYNTLSNSDLGEGWGIGNVFNVSKSTEYTDGSSGANEDLHLKTGASAIDAAVDDPLPYHPALAWDLDNAARPGSSPWDAGCYIFTDTGPTTIQRRRILQY